MKELAGSEEDRVAKDGDRRGLWERICVGNTTQSGEDETIDCRTSHRSFFHSYFLPDFTFLVVVEGSVLWAANLWLPTA